MLSERSEAKSEGASRGVCLTGLLVLSWLGFGCHVEAPAPNEVVSNPDNVIVIVVDALRADRVQAQRNGVPVMPKTAAFAAEAACFTHAYSQASWTKPSMVSLFTSLYPATHRVQFGMDKPWSEYHR